MKFSTKAIHAGQEPDPSTGAIVTPIYQTSTYVQEAPGQNKGYEYARSQNPTRKALEDAYAIIENGKYALAFSSGVKFAVTNDIIVGFELNQRKTFTDYLDDVSSFYVDRNTLLQAKGAKAVELAWRTDELPGTNPYPAHGEQRGTPSEMDWYYFFGVNVEFKLSIFKNNRNSKVLAYQRCPRISH